MDWYLVALKKYAVFSGRSRRKEYWMYALVNILIFVALAVLAAILGGKGSALGVGLYGLYALFTFIPSFAITVRRLHDTNHTGWWILISIIPLLGAIVLLIYVCQEGTSGNNNYGPDPKAAVSA